MDQLRRRLLHVWAEGKRLFVTWHLYGSLPHALYPPPNKQNAGPAFVWMDRYLDSARGGPLYLKQQPIAQLVVDSIHYGAQHLRYYELEAFVVRANHVHLLVLPRVSPSRFLQTLNSSSTPRFRKLPVGNSLAFQKKCSHTPSLRWLTGDKFSMSATWGARRRRILEKPCPPLQEQGREKRNPCR